MSESMFFGIAIFVFTLLVIGLGLTVVEFRHGEPRRQHKRRKRREQRGEEA